MRTDSLSVSGPSGSGSSWDSDCEKPFKSLQLWTGAGKDRREVVLITTYPLVSIAAVICSF